MEFLSGDDEALLSGNALESTAAQVMYGTDEAETAEPQNMSPIILMDSSGIENETITCTPDTLVSGALLEDLTNMDNDEAPHMAEQHESSPFLVLDSTGTKHVILSHSYEVLECGQLTVELSAVEPSESLRIRTPNESVEPIQKTFQDFVCQVNMDAPDFDTGDLLNRSAYDPPKLCALSTPQFTSYSSKTTEDKVFVTASTPIKGPKRHHLDETLNSDFESVLPEAPIDSSCHPDSSFLESSFSANESQELRFKDDLSIKSLQDQFLNLNIMIMKRKPKLYFGLYPENLDIIDDLRNAIRSCEKHVMIILRKIRLNEPVEILADIFAVNKSTILQVINTQLPLVAGFLEQFVFWPKKSVTLSLLPVAFRANYFNVESIIDCFEVQIEQPSDPVHQLLTWSDYKHCNTMKYLISCTPDGHISFISRAYGGRTTDVEIVSNSNFCLQLKPNTSVLANRGFKHIENLLQQRNCKVVRPTNVDSGTKITKDEVNQAKVIASSRIHVERVIRRIREFSFLSPHACFHHDLLHLLDQIVIIACALSNLQNCIAS